MGTDYTFRRAALVLFGVAVEGPLPFTTPRAKNPDLREVTLEVGGKTVLRFAAAYGFRNIQNVVRKCKAGARGGDGGDGYDFVEIMACPSGCLNGGGQLPPPPAFEPGFRLSERAPLPTTLGGTTAKALVDELEELYHTGGLRARGIGVGVGAASRVAREPGANRDVAAMYETFVRGDGGSARAGAVAHAVPDRSAEAAMSAGGRPRRRRTSRSPATGSSYRERFLLDVSYSYDDVGVELERVDDTVRRVFSLGVQTQKITTTWSFSARRPARGQTGDARASAGWTCRRSSFAARCFR